MNSTSVACIVCQCEVNASAITPCVRGHHQCQVCSIRLNGLCGICTTPIELQAASFEPDAIVGVVPDTEYIASDIQALWSPPQIPINDPNIYFDNLVITDDNQGNMSTEELLADQYIFNTASYNHPTKEQEIVSTSLMDVLRNLHESKCSNSCTNFDYCIRQMLWQQFDCNQEPEENLHAISISEILQNIHQNSCSMQCDNMVRCLSTTFKHLIEKQAITVKEKSKTSSESTSSYLSTVSSISKYTDYRPIDRFAVLEQNSNVIRARYPNDKNPKSKHLQPQYEYITAFPTKSEKSKKDFTLPFCYESNDTIASNIACPLSGCEVTVEDRYLCKHFLEKHKNLELISMTANQHQLFFIDPSILEPNELNCVASFVISNIFKSPNELQFEMKDLPILVMACRVNLNELGAKGTTCSAIPKTFSEQQKDFTETNDVIDAEVAETVYGVKKRLRREPVKWACNDVLLICPIAPIPKEKAVCASLVSFAPDRPKAHISASFCIRPIRDFRTIGGLVGCPDTICLTSVDIAALTCSGQHVIHCQMMCKF